MSCEWRRIQASTPSQVRSLLETEGYFDAKVKVERREALPPQLRVEVDPGPRAKVQRIVFDMQGELERLASGGGADAKLLLEDLQSAWPLPEGSVFRNAAWADAKNGVLARLRAEGYTAASWSGTAAQVDADTHAVRLTLILDTGALYHLGDLRIEGLEQQDSLTVRHLQVSTKVHLPPRQRCSTSRIASCARASTTRPRFCSTPTTPIPRARRCWCA